uniref:Uncharacterized protein n=1 Tax=Arundo donax TaxID=35708 RepID=A0A0A8YUT1_ARUDO
MPLQRCHFEICHYGPSWLVVGISPVLDNMPHVLVTRQELIARRPAMRVGEEESGRKSLVQTGP